MGRSVAQSLTKVIKYLNGRYSMQYDYKPINTKPRTIYLDLNHTLHTPYEFNPDSGGVDNIYCKVAGRIGRRVHHQLLDGSAYCSECIELFDPGDACPRITVAGEEKGITVVTLVR